MEGEGELQMASSHHQIPEDVLMEIMIRLPVKSLLRFKCVCKNWYDIIQNRKFTCSHLRFQKLQNKGRIFLQHFNYDTRQDC